MPDISCDLENCIWCNDKGRCTVAGFRMIDLIASGSTEGEWLQPKYLVCNHYDTKESAEKKKSAGYKI